LINAEEGYGRGDQFIIDRLERVQQPIFLIINKIDKVHPDDLLPLIQQYREKLDFTEVIPISALNGNNVSTLMEQITNYMEEGPKYYPEDQVTDHPERFIVTELIREKVLHLTREEVPHSVAVVIDQMVRREDGNLVDITATIVVERPSQKGIIIGKQGKMLKEVGSRARIDIEHLLGSKVFLELWVKVQKDWRNRPFNLRDFGFNEEDY
jgi:GTP-binding protein Era